MAAIQISFDLPQEAGEQLRARFGNDLGAAAKAALAIESYRSGDISIGQAAELTGITVYEAEGLMKLRGVEPPGSPEEFEQNQVDLVRLLES